MVTRRAYIRASLVLPIALPLAVVAITLVLAPSALGVPGSLETLAVLLLPSLVVGGAPYAACAALAAMILRQKDERAHHVVAPCAPPVFAILMFVQFSVMVLVSGSDLRAAVTVGRRVAAISLAYAAAHVVLVDLLLWTLTHLGILERSALPNPALQPARPS